MPLNSKMPFVRWFACTFVLSILPGISLAGSDSAISTYKAADFETAIPLLQAACARNPNDPIAHAALLSSLVHRGRAEEASDIAREVTADFPDSSEVLAARGELSYYMGDMPEAERLFKAAAKHQDQTARAYYGLSRLCRAASLYRTARLLCMKAHDIDPEDALITRAWIGYLAPAKRKEVLDAFAASHPWLYKHFDRDRSNDVEITRELKSRKLFEPEDERKEVTLHLISLLYGPNRLHGLGLEFRMNGGRPLRLLFDTGASGILIRQTAVDKAELDHLGSGEAWGIGDKGARNIFGAIADTCRIGTLEYKACPVRATEGKQRIAGEEDGLIGADVFSDYLIEIDFGKHLLHLTPLPAREPNPQGYDRVIGPDRAGFTPVFRYGAHLFVTTKVNDKNTGLFLLDTGSSFSNIDSAFARLSTKIHGDGYTQIRGVSGQVKQVFDADKAVIQFARFRQTNLGLIAFNLNNVPEPQEIRTAGILGLPVLAMFRLTLDYRDGLVKFDYVK